jgi:N-alpha-acetyltransferase 35, NatC auxiliary subunit
MILMQTLLVQDGKLYGEYFFSDVISRALSLPDIIGDKEFQMNEFVVQLGQVRHQDILLLYQWLFCFCVYLELSLINNMMTLQLVINLIKILCTNTAWQRRKLGKSLQDWSTISIQVCVCVKSIPFCLFLLSSVCISRHKLSFHVGKRIT